MVTVQEIVANLNHVVLKYSASGLRVSKSYGLFYYVTTHQNQMNYSSVDLKTLRDFLGLVRSVARVRIIRQSQTTNFDFISKGVEAAAKGAVRSLVDGI
ncbi:hypothetical protein TNCV_1523491 [Trichonephila clavipes]|nr:hypothetical protein TNCV_1523491 [Trichonephila clavipes]